MAGQERCHQRQQRGQVGGEVDVQTWWSALPRPFSETRTADTFGRRSASPDAMAHVPSVLALSAMVMRKVNGNGVRR